MMARRLALIDAARGLALGGMIVFHARWDMGWLGLLPGAHGVGPVWQAFGNAIAAVFLFLSGVSLVLAQRRGAPPVQVLRRLALLLAAALVITLATWAVVPERAIFFGILHCIVVGDCLALPFLKRPPVLPTLLACALFSGALLRLPDGLHGQGWAWIGLGSDLPDTLDYRPVIPWAGFVLLGVGAARMIPEAKLSMRMVDGAWGGGMAWAGRHSLGIYLGHQLVLFPAFFLVALTLGVSAPARSQGWSAAFEAECTAHCSATGAAAGLCRSTCRCVRSTAESDGLAETLTVPDQSGPRRQRLAEMTGVCFSKAETAKGGSR